MAALCDHILQTRLKRYSRSCYESHTKSYIMSSHCESKRSKFVYNHAHLLASTSGPTKISHTAINSWKATVKACYKNDEVSTYRRFCCWTTNLLSVVCTMMGLTQDWFLLRYLRRLSKRGALSTVWVTMWDLKARPLRSSLKMPYHSFMDYSSSKGC